MKKFLVLAVFVLFSNLSFSQLGGEDEVYLGGEFIEAKFQNGGIDKFYDYIIANFDTKTVEKKGQIIFEFTVNEKWLSIGAGLTGWSGLARYASPSVGSILSTSSLVNIPNG